MNTTYYNSPLGLIRITASDAGIRTIFFLDGAEAEAASSDTTSPNTFTDLCAGQLQEYFEGKRQVFDVPLAPAGTAFQQRVWQELLKVPFGKTDTYSSIAQKLENPLSVRAVGAANGRNPISIIVPCHRIIGANGSLTGYAGGLWRKEKLLALEGIANARQATLW
jgi:methylated-DNA-[protein]-cysteine S-methyltransferase